MEYNATVQCWCLYEAANVTVSMSLEQVDKAGIMLEIAQSM